VGKEDKKSFFDNVFNEMKLTKDLFQIQALSTNQFGWLGWN
jgi:hypothetical protein